MLHHSRGHQTCLLTRTPEKIKNCWVLHLHFLQPVFIFMEIKYILYFLIGGFIVSAVTYLASHAKGLQAAFIANLPVVTVITFLTIYFESDQRAIVSYAKGLIIMLFP